MKHTHMESLRRFLAILDVLTHAETPLGVTEISRRVRLSKATTYRLLQALACHGLARMQTPEATYGPGFLILELAGAWLDRLDVRAKALPILRHLREKTGETVSLNLLAGHQRVAVEHLEASHELRFVVEVGRPLPLHLGATGKAILAFLPDADIKAILHQARVKNTRRLLEQLARVRTQGFAVSFGERLPGSASASAPIQDHTGRVVGSVSILSTATRFTPEAVRSHQQVIVEAARAISRALGHAAFGQRGGSSAASRAEGPGGRP